MLIRDEECDKADSVIKWCACGGSEQENRGRKQQDRIMNCPGKDENRTNQPGEAADGGRWGRREGGVCGLELEERPGAAAEERR